MNPWGYDNGARLAAASGVDLAIHGGVYAPSGAMARVRQDVLAQWPGVVIDDRKATPATIPGRCTLGRLPGAPVDPDDRLHGATAPPKGSKRRAQVVDDSPEPKLLQARVDALYLAYNGELRPEFTEHLSQRLDEARIQGLAVAVDLDCWGAVLRMSPMSYCWRGLKGIEGKWHLSCEEITLRVDSGGSGGWRIEVRPSAVLLGRVGHEVARAMARELAAVVLVEVLEERVRRVDLCADWLNYDLASIGLADWIAPRRTKAADLSLSHRYSYAGIVSGWALGKSDISHRTYDKTRELREPGHEVKREEEHARWRAQGWSGGDRPLKHGEEGPEYQQVARTEFEVRGQALKQFPALGNLRDPDVLFRSLDAVWAYLTDARPSGPRGAPLKKGTTTKVGPDDVQQKAGWCRLVVLGTASRRHRCRTQRRWRAVQRVTFAGVVMPVPARERIQAAAPERRAVGQILDLVAAEGLHEVEVPPLGKVNLVDMGRASEVIAQARDSYAGWSEVEAERYVRALLEDHRVVTRFKQATRAWPEDEARRRGGWRGAAAYYIERQRAAIARHGGLTDRLRERAALAKCAAEDASSECERRS